MPIDELISFESNNDPKILQLLKLTLRDKEEERASWGELKLSRVFSSSISNKEAFVSYVGKLLQISKWLLTCLKDEKLTEKPTKLFMYFMTKYQCSAN